MPQKEVRTHYQDGRHKVDVKVTIIEFEEDGVHFIYSPMLDLTGYGKTIEEARASYEEACTEFIRYTANKGTVVEELKRLGWNVSNKNKIKAPQLTDLIQNREYLEDIFNTRGNFIKRDETLAIPA